MSSVSDVERILDLAVEELGERLADPYKRSEMSDNVLKGLLEQANKAAERREAKLKELVAQDEAYDALEVILINRSLTQRKKEELIWQLIAGYEREIARCKGAMEGDPQDD